MKKFLIFSFKLALAFTLLYWLYDSDALDLNAFRQLEFNATTAQLLGLNALLLFAGAILLSLRMWRLLVLLEFEVSKREAIRVNLASMCLGLMLPGLVGVDAIRATYFCLQNRDRKVDAFSCILADRIIGIYALLLLATMAAIIALAVGLEAVDRRFLIFLAIVLLGVSLGVALLMSRRLLVTAPLSIIYDRLPALLRDMVTALQHLGSHRRDIVIWLGISVISQGITIVNFVIIGILIRDNLPILAHFILNPVALFFNSVPITPGGLGITESVFAYLYESAYSNNGALISLLGRLNQYVVYIVIGLPALFMLKFNFAFADVSAGGDPDGVDDKAAIADGPGDRSD